MVAACFTRRAHLPTRTYTSPIHIHVCVSLDVQPSGMHATLSIQL